MKIGYFILNDELRSDPRMAALFSDLEEATFEVYEIRTKSDVRPDTDLVLSMGGDGTFLSAAHTVADIGLPILGVNFGRIGFLCENRPEAVRQALSGVDYSEGALYFMAKSAAEEHNVDWFEKDLKYLFKYGYHEFYTVPDYVDMVQADPQA